MELTNRYRQFFLSKNSDRKKLMFFTRLMAFTEVMVFAVVITLILINFAFN